MFIDATFHFTEPFCDCSVLSYGYGLSAISGEPAFTFQCSTCGTTVAIPFQKMDAGFSFDYMPPGVSIEGMPSDNEFVNFEQTSDEPQDDSLPVVERENVIYGPWAGSDRPDDQTNDGVDV